jgi:nicotinamidase-related amidase
MNIKQLPIPKHFDAGKVGKIWKVNYEQIAKDARQWAEEHNLTPAINDEVKTALVIVDVQNTFCIPEFELFVGGRSGHGAVDDNVRLCEFIYKNLGIITEIIPTMDTHQAVQIFHSIFLINDEGKHPDPYTLISYDDIQNEVWKINPDAVGFLGYDEEKAQQHLVHYTKTLKEKSKYDLTIWPYHAMLGGIGHALVPAVEEAIFFHSAARYSQPDFQVKGRNPLTEHYSVFGPEIRTDAEGRSIAEKNNPLLDKLAKYDIVIMSGQAKSHCLAWTIDDLLHDFLMKEKELTKKVYLLEDTSSPVVVPGVIDYTDDAEKAFIKFADAGMHVVKTTRPIDEWPDIKFELSV